MKDIGWEIAASASRAERRQAELWGEALRARGFTLTGRPKGFSRARAARTVRFGWDRYLAAVRVVTSPPFPSRRPPRADRVVVVPDAELEAELVRIGMSPGSIHIVPYPIPEQFLDWSDSAAVFQVTTQYHLEARPRIVAHGDWTHGQALTRLLPAARRALALRGELVLLDALPHRAVVAPAVAALGLQGSVVMLPPLSVDELGGLYRSADMFVQADAASGYPHTMRWAIAAGVPTLAVDDALTRRASANAAAVVNANRQDAWPRAVERVLNDVPWREEMLDRARRHMAAGRLSDTAAMVESLIATTIP